MPNPRHVMRLLVETLVFLLGALLTLLAATGRYAIPERSPAWLALGAFLLYWGLRAWVGRREPSEPTVQAAVRSGSLILVGAVMLVTAWTPFGYTRELLVAAGFALMLRGILGIAVAARARTP
jgi:hypothetical protein